MGMNSVTAGQVLRRLSRGKHIFSTNGAVVFVFVFQALMCFKDRDGNAHAALVTVTKRFHSTHAAETTLITMEGLFTLMAAELATIIFCILKRELTSSSYQ
jgi:hypothetical protein